MGDRYRSYMTVQLGYVRNRTLFFFSKTGKKPKANETHAGLSKGEIKGELSGVYKRENK